MPPLPPYGLVEAATYKHGVTKIGSFRRLDDALSGIMWALANNPKVYDIVEGMKDVRLLKTDRAGDLPAMRIWFRIDENNKRVELLMIESVYEDNGDT